MKEKAFKLNEIMAFLMASCILFFILIGIIIGLCYICYNALRNVTQHPIRACLLVIPMAVIIIYGVQLEIQRKIEREKQREIEREKQREIEREKQREIARQKLLEEQRVQELLNVISFCIFIVVIVSIYKGISYLLTPNYHMLQQKQFQMNIHNIQRTQDSDIWVARVRREWAREFPYEWQEESYQNERGKENSSVNWRKKYETKNQKRQAPIEEYRNRQLVSCTSNLYLENKARKFFKPNFFLLKELNFEDYKILNKSFSNKSFSCKYKINKVKKIHNENVLNKYCKQKLEYYNIYGNELREIYLFHGTTRNAIDSICTNNFDLTRVESGLNGWGISFANNPYFASHYSTKYCNDENYVMILARVLIGRKQVGYGGQMYPDQGFDTTTRDDGQVLVKYDEDTFYPEFIVYFSRKRELANNEWW